MDKKCQFDPECIYKELLIFNIFKLCNLHPGAAVINTPRWTSLWKECKFDFTLRILCKLFYDEEFYSCFCTAVICETYVGFLGKRNGGNLKTCKFVIPKLPLMEGVEITSWSINCPKCVRKVEWVALVGVDPERTVLLTTRALGRDPCLSLVRVRGSSMSVEKNVEIQATELSEVMKDKRNR